MIEEVCPKLQSAYVVLLRESLPTVVWVKRLALRGPLVTMQLVRALALLLKKAGAPQLTPLHIDREENDMADITSH